MTPDASGQVMADDGLSWKRYLYAGWIPTTTGHLSFSSIGVDRTRQGVFAWNRRLAEKPDPKEGVPDVFAFQWRHNPEFGLLRRTINSIFTRFVSMRASAPRDEYDLSLRELIAPPHTSQYFLFEGYCGRSLTPFVDRQKKYQCEEEIGVRIDEVGEIRGRVWVIVKNRFIDDGVWKSFKEILSSIAKLNSDFRLQNQFADVWHNLNTILGSRSLSLWSIRVDFVLYRTGEIRIGSSDDVVSSLNSQSPYGVDIPIEHRQVYYFIKDICHRHHHHRTDEDRGTRLTPVDFDDTEWRRRTLWDLAKIAGKLRRQNSSLMSRRKALGVTAYAEAFQGNLAQHRRDSDKFRYRNEIATYDYAAQQKSISASNETASFRRQGQTTLIIAFVAFLMSFIAIYHSSSATLIGTESPVCIFDVRWRFTPPMIGLIVFLILFDLVYKENSYIRTLSIRILHLTIALARPRVAAPYAPFAIAVSLGMLWLVLPKIFAAIPAWYYSSPFTC